MWRALAISVAVHALLLSPQYSPQLMDRAGAVLNATLRPPAAVAAAAAPVPAAPAVAPVRPLPAAAAPAHADPFAVPVPAPVAVPPARPAGSRPKEVQSTLGVPTFPAASMAGSDTAIVAESAAAITPGAAQARGSAPATGGGAGSGAGIDADGLRQYRLALAREARRFKRYPERAMLAGIGGTAQVRIDVAADGGVRDARLAGSSGNDSLDAAAVAMMRQAAPRALLPETLRGRAFPVTLPVIFDPAAD